MSSQYDYFFRHKPEVKNELTKLRIRVIDVDTGDGEPWPGLQLPSGNILAIAQDDEGNGPGAIHVYGERRTARE